MYFLPSEARAYANAMDTRTLGNPRRPAPYAITETSGRETAQFLSHQTRAKRRRSGRAVQPASSELNALKTPLDVAMAKSKKCVTMPGRCPMEERMLNR